MTSLSKQYDLLIGIDTGVNTGFAVYHPGTKKLIIVETVPIHKAMEQVTDLHLKSKRNIKVRFEDARQVKFKTSTAKAQGAGYVKAHAQIWETFLKDKGIEFEAVRPVKALTKLDQPLFSKITGWTGKTSNHARDAAMLVYGF